MTALIVDDERLARLELRRLLGAHPEVEIVGEVVQDQSRPEKSPERGTWMGSQRFQRPVEAPERSRSPV
jgi:DNA-binding LytR/AlgR family response regulator